jgi:uncharacterized protein (DUF1697 family)
MPVIISMLRAVNLVNHNRIKMDALRELYESLGFEKPRTYVQSGNVIFKTKDRNLPQIAKRIEDGIEERFAFRPAVIVRTSTEMKDVVSRNPFAKRRDIEPAKLLAMFLAADPGEEARKKVRSVKTDPEELRIDGRELFIYFPNGMGRSKLSWTAFEKVLNTAGTGRNWNSVTNMLEIAESME